MSMRGASEAHMLDVSKQVNDEIQRFESVHPYIYRAYNLINTIDNISLREQLEKEVVLIEDAFIRSQEWTLTRNVPSIHLGVVGSMDSGKTPLIHRYLTGKYRTPESTEGGRFKKEVCIDGNCHLLLIRDEGAQPPDLLFTHWFDGALIVFSVANRGSFNVAKHYLQVMADYRRHQDYPIIVIATLESVSQINQRCVTEEEAKRYSLERNCGYIEVDSISGSNIEHVFRTICKSITNAQMDAAIAYRRNYRAAGMSTTSGNGGSTKQRNRIPAEVDLGVTSKSKRSQRANCEVGSHISHTRSMSAAPVYAAHQLRNSDDPAHFNNHFHSSADYMHDSNFGSYRQRSDMPAKPDYHTKFPSDDVYNLRNRMFSTPRPSSDRFQEPTFAIPATRSVTYFNGSDKKSMPKLHPQLPTPNSTPTNSRKYRISNIWRKDKMPLPDGHGREIPLKQGYLYKRGNARITWKKKYVCLFAERLCYYENMKAFQEQSSQVKEVFLGLATVRVPNSQTRNRRSSLLNVFKTGKENVGPSNTLTNSVSSIPPASATDRVSIASDTNGGATSTPGEDSSTGGISDLELGNMPNEPMPSTVNETKRKKKKHHRRLASFGVRPNDDDEDNEFEVVTSDQRRLEFSASSNQERDEWVGLIGQQISKALSLQLAESRDGRMMATKNETEDIFRIPGNEECADCGNTTPVWAAYNHGITICIECSGVHRKLGTHVSKVRSLELDQWPHEYIDIMKLIGNRKANAVWEKTLPAHLKIESNASTSDRTNFIENKYVRKAYVGPSHTPPKITLLDAIHRKDFDQFARILPSCTKNDLVSVDDSGRSSAHYAALASLPEFLLLLSWNQANLTKKDANGKTALDYAMKNSAVNPQLLSDIRPSSSDDLSLSNNNIPVQATLTSGFTRIDDPNTSDVRNDDSLSARHSQTFSHLPSSVL
ncbi:CBR-CNT-2 protein [Aphelenchoides besseyi]|nr:CBR-CNT-2 protein [Aphelenchoides besseyi]